MTALHVSLRVRALPAQVTCDRDDARASEDLTALLLPFTRGIVLSAGRFSYFPALAHLAALRSPAEEPSYTLVGAKFAGHVPRWTDLSLLSRTRTRRLGPPEPLGPLSFALVAFVLRRAHDRFAFPLLSIAASQAEPSSRARLCPPAFRIGRDRTRSDALRGPALGPFLLLGPCLLLAQTRVSSAHCLISFPPADIVRLPRLIRLIRPLAAQSVMPKTRSRPVSPALYPFVRE